MVYRHFDELSFFVSTYKDGNEHKAELLRQRYPNSQIEIEVVDKQPVFEFDHDWIPGQFYTHEPYAISVSPQAVMAQLWQLEQGLQLFLNEAPEDETPNCIIRCRPDLWFHSFKFSTDFILKFEDGRKRGSPCFVPWWGRFGGINDRFAIMDRQAAYAYFFTHEKAKALIASGCPIHPESLIKASLENEGVSVSANLKSEFSTLRENGQIRPPEISLIDLAHFHA